MYFVMLIVIAVFILWPRDSLPVLAAPQILQNYNNMCVKCATSPELYKIQNAHMRRYSTAQDYVIDGSPAVATVDCEALKKIHVDGLWPFPPPNMLDTIMNLYEGTCITCGTPARIQIKNGQYHSDTSAQPCMHVTCDIMKLFK